MPILLCLIANKLPIPSDCSAIQSALASRTKGAKRIRSTVALLLTLLFSVSSLLAQDISQQAYLKASNTGAGDEFGAAVAISGDTLVVAAPTEDSMGTEADNSASAAGAVYVFVRAEGVWMQQAYLKPAHAQAGDRFGQSIALAGDTLIVGANGEDSAAVGIDGDQTDNSALGSGAAYIFVRTGNTWTQQAYLKASNAEAGDAFGSAVSIAGDTVVVGAISEDSDGAPTNNNASGSGAAYVFIRNGTSWSQQAYLKASTPGASDQFGFSVSLAGQTLVIGANQEDSSAIGVNGEETNNLASNSGAAYVFVREAGLWTQQAYLKASNTGSNDQFGFAVSLAGDLIAISAPLEASTATGIDGNQTLNTAAGAGAVYLFRRDASTWEQEAYVKASNTAVSDGFGQSLALTGNVLVVGAMGEDSNATGLNGSQTNNIGTNSGAAYMFEKLEGVWGQQAYLKASNTGSSDQFGRSLAISDRTAVVGANLESSAAMEVNGNQSDNTANSAGAAYVFIDVGMPGLEPEIDLEQPLGEPVADEGSVVDYGLVGVGAPAVTREFTVLNRGMAGLLISGVSVSGSASADFSVNITGMSNTLPAGQSTTFTVSFTPNAAGRRIASLYLVSNDSDESPYEITLTGAVLPEIAVSGNDANITDGDTEPSASDHTDFGSVEVVGGTGSRRFLITNTGVADLVLSGVTLRGLHADDFTVSLLPSSPVAPGGFTTLEITFDPSQIGLRTAEVSLLNNDGNENPFNFHIQGLGTGPGLEDTEFGVRGRVQTSIGGGDERARSLAFQSDGKIVVAGYAENGLDTDIAVARYLSDGRLDADFGTDGIVLTPIGVSFDEATGIAMQSDGKIIVCGFAYNGSNDDFVVVRYLTNGAQDSSFGRDGVVTTQIGGSDDRAYGLAVQSNGRIVVVGSAHTGSNAEVSLVRYLSNGSLDLSFGSGGKVTTNVAAGDDLGYSLALQRDGKIVVTGQADNGISDDLMLLRYLSSGKLDTSFGNGGRVVTPSGISDSAGFSVAVRRNGQIIVGGYTTNPTDTDWMVARFLSNGTLDTSFGTDGQVITDVSSSYEEINGVVVQADGGVLAAGFTGRSNTDDIAVMRYLNDGSVDMSFGDEGKVVTALGSEGDYAFSLGVQTDGRIVVAGHTNNGSNDDFALVRYIASPIVLPPEIVVEQPIGVEISQGSALDFGEVRVGESGESVTISIVNDGTEPLIISDVIKGGSATGDYVLDLSGMNPTLGSGASTSFTVVFAPTTFGTRQTTLRLLSNDSDEGAFDIQLGGLGLAPEIQVTGNGAEISSGDPSPSLVDHTDFGNVVVVSGLVTRTFTIANLGTLELNLTGMPLVKITGDHAADFTVSLSPDARLNPLALTTFEIKFDPSSPGLRSALVTVENDDADESSYTFTIAGTGVTAPVITDEPDSGGYPIYTSVSLSVGVGGTAPFEYQWSKDGEVIPGANGPVYSIARVNLETAGSYRVEVTNTYGFAMSQAALITVLPNELLNSDDTLTGPGLTGAILYRPLSGVIGPDGVFVVNAQASIGPGGITSGSDQMILTNASGHLEAIGQEGQRVGSGLISRLFYYLNATSSGAAHYRAVINGASVLNDTAFFTSRDGQSLEILSQEGDETPEGGMSFTGHISPPAISQSGIVYFDSKVVGSAVTTKNDTGVWYDDEGDQGTVAREGARAPTGINIADQAWYGQILAGSVVAGAEAVSFIADLQADPLNAANKTSGLRNSAIFTGTAGDFGVVVRKGDVIAGRPLRGFNALAVSPEGGHAFVSQLTQGGAVTSANALALFYKPVGGAGMLVAQKGDSLPGAGVINVFERIFVADGGQVIFEVTLTNPSSSDNALCRWTVAGGVQVLMQEGDAAPGGGLYGPLRTLSVSGGGKVMIQDTRAVWRDVGQGMSLVLKVGDRVLYEGTPSPVLSLAVNDETVNTRRAGGGFGGMINDDGAVLVIVSVGSGNYTMQILP